MGAMASQPRRRREIAPFQTDGATIGRSRGGRPKRKENTTRLRHRCWPGMAGEADANFCAAPDDPRRLRRGLCRGVGGARGSAVAHRHAGRAGLGRHVRFRRRLAVSRHVRSRLADPDGRAADPVPLLARPVGGHRLASARRRRDRPRRGRAPRDAAARAVVDRRIGVRAMGRALAIAPFAGAADLHRPGADGGDRPAIAGAARAGRQSGGRGRWSARRWRRSGCKAGLTPPSPTDRRRRRDRS